MAWIISRFRIDMYCTWKKLRGCLAIATLVTAALWPMHRSAAEPPDHGDVIENPHWEADQCSTCHDMSSGAAKAIAVEQIDALCLSCHDGKKAKAEVHPVHRAFEVTKDLVRPKGFTVVDNKIGCVTCHDAQFACEIQANSRLGNPNFLREVRGSSNGGDAFCAKCHLAPAYQKTNPHLMVTPDGKIDQDKCLLCHSKAPDAKATVRTSNADLKASQKMLCGECHIRHADSLTQHHIGLKVDRDDQAYIYAREVLGLVSRPSKEFVQKLRNTDCMPRLIVTAKDGEILCSTCHNPHQQGVFGKGSDLDFSSMRLNADKKLVSPVREPIWCRYCHPMS